jgi:hypothetical protein
VSHVSLRPDIMTSPGYDELPLLAGGPTYRPATERVFPFLEQAGEVGSYLRTCIMHFALTLSLGNAQVFIGNSARATVLGRAAYQPSRA